MAEVLDIKDWVGQLLKQLESGEVKKLNQQIGFLLRQRNAQRIADQVQPDGTPFEERKDQRGTLRQRSMFKKLRTRRHIKIRSRANGVTVGFEGRSGSIARTHHYGLRETFFGQSIQFAERKLLGFTDDDIQAIQELIENHLLQKNS
ncbi:phage virion morphogenesis protein [Maricurvus nonylphenolicus]|uniref:phage virion morphogenesis protein n=1 Tax=Maricurvus nonylphenolicus TaxID=1008307 RepID=UPI0036F309F2